MKPLFTLWLFSFIITSTAFAQTFQVGHKQQAFIDPSRNNRNITTEIYYPATTAGNNVPVASGQFPVLVFGHGFVMTWSAYDVVWNALVPNGYIMVFPTTETTISPSHTDFGKDIAFLVGALKSEGLNASSVFYGAVAPTSAVMGHSMGGGAAFLSVQYDASITALVTLAAAVTNPSSVSAATAITIPSLVVSAANDCVTPPSQHQIPMYDSLASTCKTLVSITGGSHCQFAGSNFFCSLGEATCSPQATISPAMQQATASGFIIPWLDFYLKSDCAAGPQFQNLISAGLGITSQQNCALACTGTNETKNDSEITIFPNPFSDHTTIYSGHELQNATLVLYNGLGKKVKQIHNITGKVFTFSREELTNGLYQIHLEQSSKVSVIKKIVITK